MCFAIPRRLLISVPPLRPIKGRSLIRGEVPKRRAGLRKCTERETDLEVAERQLWEATDPMKLVQMSSVFYGAMTVAAVFLGNSEGLRVFEELTAPVDVVGGLLWTTPMTAALVFSVTFVDRFPALGKIRDLLQRTLLPVLRKMPSWGPIVLAIGAGLGEESLFRGWMQPTLMNKLLPFSAEYAAQGGLFLTSVAFGLCHAVTATYFAWATVFGVLLGLEYQFTGLPAAVFTHALYDWIAFVTLKEMWKSGGNESIK